MPDWRHLLSSARHDGLIHPNAGKGGCGPGHARVPGPHRGYRLMPELPRDATLWLDEGGAAVPGPARVPHPASPAGRHFRWQDISNRRPALDRDSLESDSRNRAWSFFIASGKSVEQARDLMGGIDFSQPVEVIVVAAGTSLIQQQAPGSPQGDWYTMGRTRPTRAGISRHSSGERGWEEGDFRGAMPRRVLPRMELRRGEAYVATDDVAMLKSVAASVRDTWSLASRRATVQTEGGALQYYSADKRNITRAPSAA